MSKRDTTLPPCPDCGGPAARKGVREGSTVHRYRCLGEIPNTLCASKPRIFTDNTKDKPRPGAQPKPEVKTRDYLREDTHVFLVTYAQNATPVHSGFWAALGACKEDRDADLICIQGRYRNPTTRNEQADDEWWVDEVVPHLWNKREDLCPNLTILGDMRVQPTAVRPLTGLDPITGGKSGILGHPKLEMRTVATPQRDLPKIMHTTGACTVKNYSDSKAGRKGEFHHTIGALLIEIRGDVFHMRQLNACKDGSFIDLDREYLPDGTVRPAPPAEALCMGDWHSGMTCPDVISATFTGDDAMVEVLRPKRIFWDDLLDQYARNHHDKDDPFVSLAKSKSATQRGSLKREVEVACNEVNQYTTIASARAGHAVQSIIKSSNHDEALTRWVKERNWKNDPENAEFYLETALRMARETEMMRNGHSYPQAFHVWARELCPEAILLGRQDSYMVLDVECAMHGDVGPNGTRGNINSIAKIGVKTFIGHSHTPGIVDGAYQVGTSTYLDLHYNRGPSSWLNCHGVIYANGKRALLAILDGEWRHT